MTKKFDVISIGETMIMLSPPDHHLIETTHSLNAYLGGAESNLVIALQHLGLKTAWISKLPKSALGYWIANKLRSYGVDTSQIIWTPDGRVGLFFVEFGAHPRPTKTIYDRSQSTTSTLSPEEIDYQHLIQTHVIHQTGITPALSPSCSETTLSVAMAAQEAKVIHSFDVNYRSLLWDSCEAQNTLNRILPFTNILIVTSQDTYMLLEDKLKPEEAAKQLHKEYNSDVVVITMGGKGSLAYSKGKTYKGPVHEIKEVNRLGAGDAYDAGFIYGFLKGGVQEGLIYGSALAALKYTMPLNIAIVELKDVENLIKGSSTQLQR